MATIHHIKTFSNGSRLDYAIEWDVAGITFSETAYIDDVPAGRVVDCLGVDIDGKPVEPRAVGGVRVAAYVDFDGKSYCLSACEAAKVHAIRKARPDVRTEAQKQASDSATAIRAERRRKEREWDALYNEGGDGYNPYREPDYITGSPFDPRERHYPDGA